MNGWIYTLSILFLLHNVSWTRAQQTSKQPATRPPSCPDGFYDGCSESCYKIIEKTGADYRTAKQECAALNASLASVHDGAEKLCFGKPIERPSGTLWIGLRRANVGVVWQWENGLTLDYTNWARGQPDIDDRKLCAFVFRYDVAWYNADCSTKRINGYICEKDKFPLPAKTTRIPFSTGKMFKPLMTTTFEPLNRIASVSSPQTTTTTTTLSQSNTTNADAAGSSMSTTSSTKISGPLTGSPEPYATTTTTVSSPLLTNSPESYSTTSISLTFGSNTAISSVSVSTPTTSGLFTTMTNVPGTFASSTAISTALSTSQSTVLTKDTTTSATSSPMTTVTPVTKTTTTSPKPSTPPTVTASPKLNTTTKLSGSPTSSSKLSTTAKVSGRFTPTPKPRTTSSPSDPPAITVKSRALTTVRLSSPSVKPAAAKTLITMAPQIAAIPPQIVCSKGSLTKPTLDVENTDSDNLSVNVVATRQCRVSFTDFVEQLLRI